MSACIRAMLFGVCLRVPSHWNHLRQFTEREIEGALLTNFTPAPCLDTVVCEKPASTHASSLLQSCRALPLSDPPQR